MDTVADEDASRVFDLAAKAVESGQDLRLLCRELARVVRDMMVVAIDPARIEDPEFAPEGDVPRLQAAAARFSREDLLRAFDVIARAEYEVRTSAQPRYHLEMALLRWIHLRKLQPLAEIISSEAACRGGHAALRPRPPDAPTRGPPLRLGRAPRAAPRPPPPARPARHAPRPSPRQRPPPPVAPAAGGSPRRSTSRTPSSSRCDSRRSCSTARSLPRRSASTSRRA